jgi:hypothetical protein
MSMVRTNVFPVLVLAAVAGILGSGRSWAQDNTDLTGQWTLNRGQSQFPREIGFNPDWASPRSTGSDTSTGGGRGRRGSGGGGTPGAFPASRETPDDLQRVSQLTDEVRAPAARLTIVDTPSAVTITDDRERSRTFHPSGKEELLQLDGVPVAVTARRESGRLVILYKVEQGRELRYSFSRTGSPSRLVVDVQLVGRGGGDKVQRVYEPGSATEQAAPTAPPAPTVPPAPAAAPAPAQPDLSAAQTFNQQPGAELKGLRKLGSVVEDLSPQARACGLNQNDLETSVSKRLSDAGFTVRRNSDEDSYVYVDIITTNLSTGLCVSRYDVFLYTHTTAKLSYQQAPVLVEVSLLHKGGIAGGAPAAHADSVLRGVMEYLDQFTMRIRDANK